MSTRLRWLIRFGCGVLAFVALIAFADWFLFIRGSVPSRIVDFYPTYFQARAETPFFYSINDELRFSDSLDEHQPLLIRGNLGHYLVSPDKTKIAIVVDRKLMIVGTAPGTTTSVVSVDSIYREHPPIGKDFFRDDDFQWTRDSKQLYLIRDKFYREQGSQLYSANGELWRYDLESRSVSPVIRPFVAYSYFFGRTGYIYFSQPTPVGDLHLYYFDGTKVADSPQNVGSSIPLNALNPSFTEEPFASFSSYDLISDVGRPRLFRPRMPRMVPNR